MANWEKVGWTSAGQVLELISLDKLDETPEADLGLAPQSYCEGLVKAKRMTEAVSFIGHALPRYEAIVWSVRVLMDKDILDRTDPMVNGVLRWIDNPDDGMRRHLRALSNAERKSSPARYLAQAVFYSGGSMSEPDLPAVLPPPDAAGKSAAAAIISAAIDTGRGADIYPHAVELGERIACNGLDA